MKRFSKVKAMIAVQPLTYDYFIENMGLPMFMLNAETNTVKNKEILI